MKIFTNRYSVYVIRLVLGITFVMAGLSKISSIAGFARDIHNYQMAPDILVNLGAIILPWLELFCGLLLILGLFGRASSVIILGLNVMFTVAVITAITRGLEIDCGCFGKSETVDPMGWITIARDFILAAISIAAVWGDHSLLSLENHIKNRSK